MQDDEPGTAPVVPASLAVAGFMLAYVAALILAWPRLGLDPLTQRWALYRLAPGPVMTYYGLLLWGTGGALVGAAAGWLLRRPLARQAALLALWALTALVLGLAFCAWHHWPWRG